MNLNKYFVAFFGVVSGFFLLGSAVFAQDSRMYITVPAQKNASKSGGSIEGVGVPLRNGEVYCAYEEGFRPRLFLENAQAQCDWTVSPAQYVEITNQYGTFGDTVVIYLKTPRNALTDVTISVKEGSYRKDIQIIVPRQAGKAGRILVDDLIGNDTTYCADLEYRVHVAEDPAYTPGVNNYNPDGLYPTANLRYRWTIRDASGVIGSEVFENPSTMYSWKYEVPQNARSWVVSPRTCENANVATDPTTEPILNVIPRNLTDMPLKVRAIRYKKEVSADAGGASGPGWDMSDNAEYRNACVWYEKQVGDRLGDEKGEHLGFLESKAGFVYLQADPYIPEDISFRHYQYEWIFDTADLILDTLRMQTDSRMNGSGFGADMPRVCFKVKKDSALSDIRVSYRMHCRACNELAARQGKNITYVSREAEEIVLPRIDTLVDDKISYSTVIRDELGDPVQVLDELPRLCGLTEYQFCATTDRGGDGGQTEYGWGLPLVDGQEWEEILSSESECYKAKSPAMAERLDRTGDTIRIYVRPANFCYANGSDTSRNGKYMYVFLRSVPTAPRVIDTIERRSYSGYTKEQLAQMSGMSAEGNDVPWPTDGVPYPLLLCNNTYFGLNVRPLGMEQAFLLHTPGLPVKPNDYGHNEHLKSGFVIDFPSASADVLEALENAYTIEPYKGKELSDTNVLVFRLDSRKRDVLADQEQIRFSLRAANECGAGNPKYFAINIIDTVSVEGHVRDNNNPDDNEYDTLSLCEGVRLTMLNESITDEKYDTDPSSPHRNTDKIVYNWSIPPTWRFDNPKTGPTASPSTVVWIGQEKGAVRLALRNRCGAGRPRSGDSINVNPYTRVNIKVVNGMSNIDVALDPKDPDPEVRQAFADNPFLLNPCRGSELMYAGDTTERTDRYRWEFPSDWQVIVDGDGYNGTAEVVPGMPNWAYTANSRINSFSRDMRVRVRVGADTGNIYVVGEKKECGFTFDNYAPDFTGELPWFGHRRDSLRVIVRPFTGKPMQDGAWPDSICVRKVVRLSVKADVTQDSLTRNQTHFTWKFPEDYADADFSSDDADFPQKNTTLTFTVPERTGEYDTITVYSHRYDCDAYNEGDSMVVILKLTDTIPFVADAYVNDARRPKDLLNLTPCEGDTVVYRVLPDPKRYLDGVWFTWNGGNAFKDTASGLIDSTGWRVLNPVGKYTDTLKMIVGRSRLVLGAQAVSPCGMSSVKQTELNPIGLVRDTIHLVKGRDLLCINEKVVFEWDSVRYATQYDWFYPWGKKHDTLGIDQKMFYREFSRKTAFDTGYIYVLPSNTCGAGPYSDSVKVTSVIRQLKAPSVKGINPSLDLAIVRDTAYDTLCLRTFRFYEAQYSDAGYADNSGWRYRWFGLAINAQDTLAVDAASVADSSVYRFRNQAGFETRYIGVSVHHKDCALGGDTLTLRIVPADTVAMDDAGLADRLSDLHREDRSIMTKPCGTDTAEWHFNGDFGKEEVSYRFVWWNDVATARARVWNEPDSTMAGGRFKWLNPKKETGSLDNIWYKDDEDVLKMRVANNQTLHVSVDLKNRCGISRLPALTVRTVTSIADSLYQLRMVSDRVCDGDSLLFKVDSSANIGGFVWHYPWGAKIDSVKVGTQVRRSFNVPLFDTGYVYVVPYNGCGNAKTSNSIHISEVLRVPERAVPSNFDPAYDYDVNHVAIDTLCMRTRQVLRVRSDSWEDGRYETQWRLVQGNATGFERGLDSCVLRQEDVNDQPFLLEFASRAKGCKRYSDTLFIRIFSMDTLTFTMVEDEDEGLGRLEVLLPAIIQNYADGTPVDRKPCGGSLQKYTIADGFHWSLVDKPAPYFSWQGNGKPEAGDPAADKTLGGTDWTFADEPVEAPGRYQDLPVRVGARDLLILHVNLHNICGSSHSPGFILWPKPAVTQKPVITPAPVCIGSPLAFDCAQVDNTDNYYWEFPWSPYRDTTGVPHLEVPSVSDLDGNVVVYGANGCGKGPADTLKAMVIHTPKAPLPDWRTGTYAMVSDTVYDTVCLYGSAILKVRQDEQDAPGVRFGWVCMEGSEDISLVPADTLCLLAPTASATDRKSVLIGVYGSYAACGGEGEKLFIRIHFEDTLASALVGRVLVDPVDLMTEPTPCPEEEIVLRVENDMASAYKWILPATWSFRESLDSTTASVTVVAGTARGRVGVRPLKTSAPMGCGSLNANPRYSVEFIPRAVPVTPAFASDFEVYPCVGSTVTYRLSNSQTENIRAYRWEFPSGWRIPGTDAAVLGTSGDTNVLPVTTESFCAVIVGKDSGDVRVYAMDSCGEHLVRGNPRDKAVYPVDTARLRVLGDQNVCLDSTVYLTVEFLNAYTKTTGYDLRLEYVGDGEVPLVVEVEDEDSTHLRIRCTNRDTVRMIFTPYNLFACPDNAQPYIHYLVTDTIPEIPGVIEGPSVVCADNPYTYVFHVDAGKKAIFEDIEYSWVIPQGWHIDSIVNDTVLHVYFDSVPAVMKEHDTILCYPVAGCGTAFPTVLVLTLQEPDEFNDSIEVDFPELCIGTELKVWLRDSGSYNTDTIRFIWNTPAGRDADWVRLDADSLPRTSYRVQYDTASYIKVRYQRDHGCGMSKTLTARVVVKDSAAKARFYGTRYPCYTREFYELAVFPDTEHIDSVSWMFGLLTATEHTRVGSSIRNDSLSVANLDHRQTEFSVGVRTFNECGSRDTVFTIIPVTTISNFESSLAAPRLCVSDTAYAYIDLTRAQRNQGLFFEWHFVPDSSALPLNEFVAGDTTAVLQFLSGAGNDSLQIVLLAGNDCSMLADSMLSPQVVDIVPFRYRIAATYDESRSVVYGFDSLRIEVDSVSVGRLDEYNYTWHPENRVYEPEQEHSGAAWRYTKTLVQNPETFSVVSRQRLTAAQEALPFYRRDGLCYAYDTLQIRVDSLLRVLAEDDEPLACVDAEYMLRIELFGGNYDRLRLDTAGGLNACFHSISWWRLQDDTLWREIPEGRDQMYVNVTHNEAGSYLYRIVVNDSTVLRDSAATDEAAPLLVANHADTADIWVEIYAAPEIHFTNVSSNPVEVAVGSRIEIDSRVEEGTGYYVYRWSSSPDTSLILPEYEDTENTRTRSIYQRASIILTVSDTLSGCLSSDTVAIRLGKGVSDIANAFTPNDDGKNDIFLKGVSELSIFTRWGEEIFHTTGGEGWNGTHNGKKVRPGDYLYVAVVYENGEKLVFKGVVTVLKVD